MTGQTPNTVIIQRQTLDWANMTEARYRSASIPFCRLWEKPDDYMTGLVRLWNDTFALDYFAVRQSLKTLASGHNSTLPDTAFIHYREYSNIPYGSRFTYTFIDDDDWLSPELAAVLSQSALAGHDACLWKGCTLGSPKSEHPLFFWGLNGRCMTNNYAVSGRWMSSPERFQRACKHSLAEHTLPELDTCLVDAWLSMTNKAPCSSVSLENALQGERRPERLKQIIIDYNRRMSRIRKADFERATWAWPLHQATCDVFLKVEASAHA